MDNAVERLMLADELGVPALKKACAQFLAEAGRLADVQETEPWERLLASRPHLAGEVRKAGETELRHGRQRRQMVLDSGY